MTKARDWVAIILAVGLSTAVNVITAAVLYDAIFSEGPGLSENATQILTGAFGGIVGILGGYIGFKAGQASNGSGLVVHHVQQESHSQDQPGNALQ